MRKMLVALSVAVLFSTAANAGTDFVGHWAQPAAEKPCSIILGFRLGADGSASIDWAASGNGDAEKNRDGHWTATDDTLHLTVTAEADPGRAPTVVNVDGSLAGGDRLETRITDNRDRNIDGQPYEIHCRYVRDQS